MKLRQSKSKPPMTQVQLASLGGSATLKKHGKSHYVKMARRKWALAKKGK